MVKEATSGISMSQEEKAFINYWFRHPWEYILPSIQAYCWPPAISNVRYTVSLKQNMVCAVFADCPQAFSFAMRGVGKRSSESND